jgi:hypothetical protein
MHNTTNDNLHVTFHAKIVCFIKAWTTNRNNRNNQMHQDWGEERLMGSLLYLCFNCQDCPHKWQHKWTQHAHTKSENEHMFIC